MEIIQKFGLDPFLFGAQAINFLIVFYLLKRFLYKPVLSTLKKREDAIKEGLKQAEEGKALFDEAVKKEKEILKKANEQAKKTLLDAKNQAYLVSDEAREQAKLQAQNIIVEARKQIELEAKEAEKRLSSKISELSIEFLERALKNMFSEKEQKEVLNIALKKLKPND